MKKLIIIRGASGVGKTRVVKGIIKKLGKKTAYIPVAHTTYELIIKDIEFASNKLIDLMHDNADDLIKNFLNVNFTVVTDAIFAHTTKGKSRLDKLIKIGYKNNAKVYVFELNANLPTILDRAKKRKRTKDVKTKYKLIEKKHKQFVRSKHKTAIEINTEGKSINKIIQEILKKL